MPQALPSLLLLSPPPSPVTSASLLACYQPSITDCVARLRVLPASTRLLVALPCPEIHTRTQLPRSQIYPELQKLLAGVYSLVCLACAKLGVDVESETPGSIDARIILLDYVTTPSNPSLENDNTVLDPLAAGPVIDLPTLALTRRRWNLIFSVDGEEGQAMLAAYMSLASQRSPAVIGRVHTLSGGVSLIQKPSVRGSPAAFSHNAVIVGGTFDHLHAGHKLLLTATALLLQPIKRSSLVNRRLIVGITGDELLKNKKYAEYLQSWKQRQEDVVDFLLSVMLFTRSAPEEAIQTTSFDEPGPNGRAIHTRLKDCFLTIECVEIQDPFGPTITDESVTALVVSAETRSGGQAVNERRMEKGWKALEVFEIDVLDAQEDEGSLGDAENFASKISSTAIRKRRAETNSVPSL